MLLSKLLLCQFSSLGQKVQDVKNATYLKCQMHVEVILKYLKHCGSPDATNDYLILRRKPISSIRILRIRNLVEV